MRYSRGARIVLAFLVFVIFVAYLYLTTASYHVLGTPQPGAVSSQGTLSTPAPEGSSGETAAQPAEQTGAETAEQPPAEQTGAETAVSVDPESPYGKALANAAAKGLPEPPNVDVGSWEFTLVNGDHSIGQYEPEQLAYLDQTLASTDISYSFDPNRCPVDARVAEPLVAMGLACKEAGLPVYLSSGYRSYDVQAQNFKRVCENNGVTDGKDAAGHYITMPAGCSEHQLALCCDITDKYYAVKNDSIVASDTIQWLLAHCADYGFVQRFPDGKQDVTQVMSESWHFRYVGTEAAQYIMDNGLCLEEFIALYKDI